METHLKNKTDDLTSEPQNLLNKESKSHRTFWTFTDVEHRQIEHQTGKLQTIEAQDVKPLVIELKDQKLEAQEYEQKIKLEVCKSQTIKSQEFELNGVKYKAIKSNFATFQEDKCNITEPKAAELKTIGSPTITAERIDSPTVEVQIIESNKFESHRVGSQALESQNLFQKEKKSQTTKVLDHHTLLLWHQPKLTLIYFLKELFVHLRDICLKILNYRRILLVSITTIIIVIYLNITYSADHPVLVLAQRKLLWCLYWFSLGMLSSVGLGAGIHTFALYLGPYIASVTVAANECGSLNFVENSDPGGIECSLDPVTGKALTLWNIMCKVRLESYMWGLGTAVGELPTYFIGRAARITGKEDGTDVLQKFEELQRKISECPGSLCFLDKIKLLVRHLVVKAGFWGILVCASIPNPFFDLVGMICGNFLVPFWTFFGGTLVGKAVIKTTVQQILVILLFNNTFQSEVVGIISKIPYVGQRLQTYFSQYIARQKDKFTKDRTDQRLYSSWILKSYHIFVMGTFLYFLISIINSLAQNYHKRIKPKKLKKTE